MRWCKKTMQSLVLIAATAATATAAPSERVKRIEVFPPQLKIVSRHHPVQLVVTGQMTKGHLRDLTGTAELVPMNPEIVRVERGRLVPVSDGTTRVLVRAMGREVKVSVNVQLLPGIETAGLVHGALAVLTRHGCNSGGCHGAPSGKGGFRLSLWAYDHQQDAETLTREFAGRRVDLFSAPQSLLLRKPLMKVPHGGGRRLHTYDVGYQLLRDWIAQGSRPEDEGSARCEKIEVFPSGRQLVLPTARQQLSVNAHFSDGTVRDVTSLVLYSSSDDTIATVSGDGLVEPSTAGETGILVRYLEHASTVRLAFVEPREDFNWQAPREQNEIDQLVFAKLKKMQISPSAISSDSQFLRRVYFDVTGLPPTVAEAREFLADESADKRARLIDQLLESPEYAAWWANKWGDLFRVNREKMTQRGVYKFYHWLVRSVRNNMPYDEFVRHLLLAKGSTTVNPAVNFYRSADSTDDCTETMAQIFLGARLQCAKCHNHPYERWTQDNYYGFGAFFHRLQRTVVKENDEMVLWVAREGEIVQPRTGQQMQGWLPGVGELDLEESHDRREVLVEWLTRPDNPYLARVEVNRIWSHLFGRGIVEPFDDFRESNLPSNQALLDWLAVDLVESGFDRKQVIRRILNSATYQLSSEGNESNRQDRAYFSHLQLRRLPAESLMEATCQVTGVPHKFKGMPAGTRATGLPSPEEGLYYLRVFGQPSRDTNCSCERTELVNLSQALATSCGDFVTKRLLDKGNLLRRLLRAGRSNEEIVEEIYLAGYARFPNDEEMALVVKFIEEQSQESEEGREMALEDLTWSLINSKEFLFQK
jgi:hypothetical protein